ncbi:hypothetical protein BJ944DRAFT_29737 [Cunninghamella echinulata]|nr:hypothetical protein BJ944DRAFT_29737 [Cunninghamella echinulata]
MYQDQHDIEQPTNPEQYERLNTVVRKIRRSRKNTLPSACCCCLTTRLGSQLACLIWAGFSLYFACLGFMKKSPFYSYLNPVTLYIYAILNLIFFFINMVGFFIITWRHQYLLED